MCIYVCVCVCVFVCVYMCVCVYTFLFRSRAAFCAHLIPLHSIPFHPSGNDASQSPVKAALPDTIRINCYN